ncbi:hypothetical protein GGH96_001927 [Coemansia sp. RSA 1972]|nr:hypothetical protein GGH96_001927 [Coemansia sp. RSA 1972]
MLASDPNTHDSINLNCSTRANSDLHLLPCSVDHCGPAKTTTYFLPTKQTDTTFEAAFRGRQIHGRTVDLPHGYTGHVVEPTTGSTFGAFENNDTSAHVELLSVEQFTSIVVWEHDQLPRPDDEAISALAWTKIAQSIHCD